MRSCLYILLLFLALIPLHAQQNDTNGDKVLENVDVVATKVQFYFDNDTLIYNADAIDVIKGAVLEDLLKKLPGVTIDGSVIYVGGERVHALLLNGKDFFNKDRHTILQNLPSFMVKSVKVYDKTRDSLSLIKRERELHGKVMDVRLKKEYNRFYAGNLRFGAGTDERYRFGAFIMQFTSNSRFSATATGNNLNHFDYISEYSSGSDYSDIGEGIMDRLELQYNADHPKGLYTLEGSTYVDYCDQISKERNISQQFYDSGDVFGRSFGRNNQYTFGVTTTHDLNFFGNTPWDFTMHPILQFSRTTRKGLSSSGSFNQDVDNALGTAWMDSLVSPELTSTMKQYGITRAIDEERNGGHDISVSMQINKDFHFKGKGDDLHFSVYTSYSESEDGQYSHNYVEHIADPLLADIYQNKYNRNRTKSNTHSLEAKYKYKFAPKSSLTASYRFRYHSNVDNRSLFLLHLLADWQAGTTHGLGELPSNLELYTTLDGDNSHWSHTQENSNRMELKYEYRYREGNTDKYVFSTNVPLLLERERLTYQNSIIDTLVSRHTTLPIANVSFQYTSTGKKRTTFSLSYDFTQQAPSMMRMLNIRDTSNPLYISEGNPHLCNTTCNTFRASFTHRFSDFSSMMVYATASVYDNAVATARSYNKKTGITRAFPVNINGNNHWRVDGYLTIHPNPKGKTKPWISFQSALYFIDNADLSNDGQSEISTKSIVHNMNLQNTLSYRHNIHEISINPQVKVSYQHSTSSRQNFEPINAWQYEFGMEASYGKKHWKARTNFRSLIRRGYSYSEMNTGEALWDIEVIRVINKVQLQLIISDILNQRKSTNYYVDGQQRLERFHNTVRRYAMLHIIYRFNTKQKKK